MLGKFITIRCMRTSSVMLICDLQSQKMSGRSLRRLPVLAHARYIGSLAMLPPKSSTTTHGSRKGRGSRDSNGRTVNVQATDVEVWLDAMEKVIDAQGIERNRLDH